MTEYEMTDIIMSRFGHMTEQASLYFALVSGYLITAYVIGARLTRLQVTVINTLFCLWTVGILVGYISSVNDTIALEQAIRDAGATPSAGKISDSSFAAYSFAVVQTIGIIVSLIFMWSVRHHKDG